MASFSSARITVNISGSPRVLVSLRLSKHGDLYLILRSAPKYRDLDVSPNAPGVSPMHSVPIIEQRYSIHPTVSLPDKNVIKHTLRIEKQPSIETFHHTKAIKSSRKFALLFCRRAPNLSEERYYPRNTKALELSIGSYDPSFSTIFYAVLVGPRGLPFILPDGHPVRIFSHDIGDYRVIALHSYLSLHSHSSGALTHFVTPKTGPQISNENEVLLSDGISPLQAAAIVSGAFIDLSTELKQLIFQEFETIDEPINADVKSYIDLADFYPEGTKESDSYRRHISNWMNYLKTRRDQWLI